MSRYYDDDNDDDPYAPRIGPAAMPSPRSKFAPYFSGCTDTLEDFLEEYEGLAYDCALTDAQRVDVLIRYVVPSLRDFWRSLDGFRSHNWPRFRQSLINVFGSTTPRPQVMRQRLLNYVQDSSRARMDCEDDVLQYYRQFLRYSAPLVHTGHLSEEERDAAFWYGFHPLDREVLQPRLLGKNPFQPPDIPFHFEDVFGCARAAFAYDDYFPSPWSHAKQFKPPIVRREQPVVEPIPRDAYSFRAVMCAIASNAETTTTPNDFPLPSHSTPDPQLPSSSSPSALESQHGLVHSVTLDQPEPAYTLPPSDSPLSHISTLVHSATDSDPVFASTPPSVSSTLLPSAFPTPSHASSLARSATDNDPILASTPPSSSISSTFLPSASPTLSRLRSHSLAHSAANELPEILSTFPSPSTTPVPLSILTSDFEYLPSATVDQPEPAPTLSSTPPSPSSISPTFLHPPVSMRSEMNNQPESEHEAASTSSIRPVMSAFASMLPSLSPTSSTFLPSPVTSATHCQHESEPASVSEIPVSKLDPSLHALRLSLPHHSPPGLSLRLCDLPANLTLSPSKFDLPPDLSASSDLSSASPPPLVLGDLELEFFPTPSSTVEIVPLSSLEMFESMSSLHEPFPILPAPLGLMTVPISPHLTPSQRPPGVTLIDSASSIPEVTPSFASSIPRLGWKSPQVYEVPSIKPPALAPRPGLFHSLGSLRRTPARFGFALALVTTAILSSLLNVSATTSTLASKFWSKKEDFGGSQNGAFKTYKPCNISAQHLRPGQYTPRAPRLVFDPGGPASSSRLLSAHEDAPRRMPKTRNDFITHVDNPILVLLDNVIVFDPGGGAFVLEPAHEDSATFDEDAQRLCLHAQGHFSYYCFSSHFLCFRR